MRALQENFSENFCLICDSLVLCWLGHMKMQTKNAYFFKKKRRPTQ